MLTHEEAAFLRSLQSDSELANNLFGWGFITYNLPDGSPCKPRLEEDGKAALAEYDREFVVIHRTDLIDVMRVVNSDVNGWAFEFIKRLNAVLEAK